MQIRSYISAILITLATQATAQLFPNLSGQPLLDAIAQAYTPDTTMSYGTARETMYARIYNVTHGMSYILNDRMLDTE